MTQWWLQWYLDLNGETLYIDEYGRPIPDVHRWPSSANGNGFKTVADKVHALGLKFGIHIMRGVSDTFTLMRQEALCSHLTPVCCPHVCLQITTTALAANAPIKGGGGARAVDIALPQDKCPWESKVGRCAHKLCALCSMVKRNVVLEEGLTPALCPHFVWYTPCSS